jgi:excisionase family DNA binding protein
MNEPEFLRIEAAAALCGLSRSMCYELVASGEIPSVRFGRRSLRIPRRQLAEWVERQSSQAVTADGSAVTATYTPKD